MTPPWVRLPAHSEAHPKIKVKDRTYASSDDLRLGGVGWPVCCG
ncbi:hypothetical protein Ae717Ps2_5870c [Pseudonocardia sp. Ae717_Ps2]|nr:hypothetical protein Ae717Ps2_5870c [Pseudonocardia sp. Ae717_Ps2]